LINNIIEEWKVNNAFITPLAKQLADNIRWSISTGNIKPGEKLPPLRDLSVKLSLSINTIRSAYKMLEDQQLIITRPYHGTMVVDFPSKITGNSSEASENSIDLLSQAVIKAINTGFTLPEIRSMFEEILEKVSNLNKSIKVLLIECSEYDCKSLSEQISRELGILVDYVVINDLDDFINQENTKLNSYKAVVTSYFHYSKVMKSVEEYNIPVLGMVMEMPSESLNYIATMPSGHKVGIICEPNHSLQYLINLLKSRRNDVEIITAFSNESDKFNRVIKDADVIFATFKEYIQEQVKSKPVLSFLDHINLQSMEMLREFLQRIKAKS